MTAEPEAPPAPRNGPKLVLGLILVLLVPLALIFIAFPLMRVEPFERVEDLDPASIQTLRVHVLNRQGIDNGPDIGPYFAAPGDVPQLLAAIKSVPEVPEFEGARGPWLGEYRVVTTEGRRGTIRFYWQPPVQRDGTPVLRYQIGTHKFEGGDPAGLIAAVEAARN